MIGSAPEGITVDFELALHNAVRRVYSNTEVYGCFFHFAQSQRRKLVDMGLTVELKEDTTLAFHVKMIRALAFVPETHLELAFACLIDFADIRLQDLLIHLETYYIGTQNRCKLLES